MARSGHAEICCRWPHQATRSRASLWQTKNEQSRSRNRMGDNYGASCLVGLTAVLLSSAAAATAAELPTFEIIGFPLTQHQLTVLNSGIVQSDRPPQSHACKHASIPVQIGALTPARSRNSRQGGSRRTTEGRPPLDLTATTSRRALRVESAAGMNPAAVKVSPRATM